MKKWLSYIISAAMACLCYSCSGNEEVTGTDPNGSGNNEGIVIRLGITSRADGSVAGSADEKKITNLKVWMVNEEDAAFSFYKEISEPDGIEFDENDIYSFEMEISLSQPGKYGFYLLANSDCISGITFDKDTKPADLQTAYFTAISGDENAPVDIPMYGEYHSVDISRGVLTYEVQVPITRMLAKLEIFFAKDNPDSKLVINQMTLSSMPDKGYIAPRNSWEELKYTGVIERLMSATDEEITAATPSSNDDYQKVGIVHPFLFENPNGGEQASIQYFPDCYLLKIHYTRAEQESYQMVSLPRIERNTIYKLYAHVHDHSEAFTLNLIAAPWILEEKTLDFTDVITYSTLGWVEDTYQEITGDHKVYMKLETAAQFQFKIDAPENADYTVALTNSTDFEKKVEKAKNGVITVTVTAKHTDGEHRTALSVYAKATNGEMVELDVTTGGGQTSGNGNEIGHYTIIQDWK